MRTLLIPILFAATTFAATKSAPTPNTERLYRVKCSPCHGAEGTGGTGPTFKAKLAHPTTASLVGVIKNGIPGTAMPGNPSMPDTAVKDLAIYVQYLNKKK